MAIDILNKYITQAYSRLLDYSVYQCSQAGMEAEAVDVLNEVLAMLLEKNKSNSDFLIQMFERKRGKYCELDYYILQMIKLNIQSPTSPYQQKYKPIPVDENVDFQHIHIIDEQESETDKSLEILHQMQAVRVIFDNLELSPKASRIFSWKFFEGNTFSEWEGPEDKNELYDTYKKVIELITNKLRKKMLF